MAQEVRKRLASLERSQRWLDRRARAPVLAELDSQRQAIATAIDSQAPALAVELFWRLLEVAPSLLDRIDDSDDSSQRWWSKWPRRCWPTDTGSTTTWCAIWWGRSRRMGWGCCASSWSGSGQRCMGPSTCWRRTSRRRGKRRACWCRLIPGSSARMSSWHCWRSPMGWARRRPTWPNTATTPPLP
ncbi:MAG: hypothetical protein VKK05_07405 [Synechococcus sp.]|nr:hypothetical protein [Synechococcus sp.]